MNIRFTKMQGLGNDFVVIDAINQSIDLSADQVRHIANRRFGVGCDQLLLVESPLSAQAEFRYRIYNADGGEVEQCGNGARCFARFVRDKGLTGNDRITVETMSGLITLVIQDDGQVTVDMGLPRLEPGEIPFIADQPMNLYPVEVDGNTIQLAAVSMGNPHAVVRVDSIENAPLESLGPLLESHERFPSRVNVGFMEVVERDHILLRVYERGAGETLACGTGACAAVVAGIINDWLDRSVTVTLPGGELVVSWESPDASVMMTGPAVSVFEGELTL